MRKFVYLGMLGLGLSTAAIAASPALAASTNAALVANGNGCAVFDGNGNLQYPLPYHEVLNNSFDLGVCYGLVPNGTGRAVQYNQNNNPNGPGTQYNCALSGNVSTSWSETISASGLATVKIMCPSDR